MLPLERAGPGTGMLCAPDVQPHPLGGPGGSAGVGGAGDVLQMARAGHCTGMRFAAGVGERWRRCDRLSTKCVANAEDESEQLPPPGTHLGLAAEAVLQELRQLAVSERHLGPKACAGRQQGRQREGQRMASAR